MLLQSKNKSKILIVLGLGLGSVLFGQESPDSNNPQPAPPPRPPESGWRRFGGPGQQPMPQQAPMPMNVQLPEQIVVPAGTWISIRVNQPLSSDHNQPGDSFSGALSQPLIANGFVIAHRGQMVVGRVSEAVKAGRVKGTSRLGVELTEISLVDGQQMPVATQLMEQRGTTSNGRDAVGVGTSTGVGAAIGAAAGGGFGAGMGAIAGAGAGLIGVLVSRGQATEIYPESVVTFRTTAPMTISTARAPQAFQSPQGQEYEQRNLQPRVNVNRPVFPSPYYRPHAYPGYYYGPSVGLYIGGPRYYGGRGYRRW